MADRMSGQSYTDAFAYDLDGNQTTDAHAGPDGGSTETTTNTYDEDDQLTKAVSGVSGETDYGYDANGSQLSATDTAANTSTTYTYDVRNRMATATVNGVQSGYGYDDAGDRVSETTDAGTAQAVTTYYLTDTNNPTGYDQPIEAKRSPGATALPSTTFVLGDRLLAQADGSGTVAYLLADGHDSTRLLADAGGNVTARFDYTAYGTALNFTPAAAIAGGVAAGTVFLFGGDAVYDPASGLYLHGNGIRPASGASFIQRDGYGYAQLSHPLSLNGYVYAASNPVLYRDRDGHEFEVLVAIGIEVQSEAGDAETSVVLGTTEGNGLVYGEEEYGETLEEFMQEFRDPGDIAAEASDEVPEAMGNLETRANQVSGDPSINQQVVDDVDAAESAGARDIRIDQRQLNAANELKGINRPDLQYTAANGQRVYVEYDHLEGASLYHVQRILANDPTAQVITKLFQPDGTIITRLWTTFGEFVLR